MPSQALSFVASRGATTNSSLPFGGKSICAVGDLYQLPAVEHVRSEDQVWQSMWWSSFRMLELDESCRVDPSEARPLRHVGTCSRCTCT